MAVIVKMTSDDFLSKFVKDFNYKKFNFLLVSQDIKTTQKYKNVYALPSLIPPTPIMSAIINNGDKKKAIKKYREYLLTPRALTLMTILVRLAVVDNSNVVLICSEDEGKYNYLDILCDFIEELYGVKIHTYKKFAKNPEKCSCVDGNKKEVVKTIKKFLKHAEFEEGKSDGAKYTVNTQKREITKKDLEKLSKGELIQLCEKAEIKVKKGMGRKDIIEKFMKQIKKRS